MIYVDYNLETYKNKISKMSQSQINWEHQRLSQLWEDGDDDSDGYLFCLKQEKVKRGL